jgi:hypothetical protein
MSSRSQKTNTILGREFHLLTGSFNMGNYGIISSVESIKLPDGPHVREFDASQEAAKKVADTSVISEDSCDSKFVHSASATTNKSEALESNASNCHSLVPGNAIDAEYIEVVRLPERKLQPISPDVLGKSETTMEALHKMSGLELRMLDALQNEGRQIIKTRLMVIWDEMSVRFERGESINGISGTGGKGMGKYLRSIGFPPAKRRSWRFEVRKEEALRLAQEKPPIKRRRSTKKEIIINSQSEADLIAKAGVRMALMSAGDNMMPPHERASKVTVMAKEIIEAIEGGHYDRLEASADPEEKLDPHTVGIDTWRNHKLPATTYNLKYFEHASFYFIERYRYAYGSTDFKKILSTLEDNPQGVLSNPHDFSQLSLLLRGIAENANLLAAVISSMLNPPPGPQPTKKLGGPPEPTTEPHSEDSKCLPKTDDSCVVTSSVAPKLDSRDQPGKSECKRIELGDGVVRLVFSDSRVEYFRGKVRMSDTRRDKFLSSRAVDLGILERWAKTSFGDAKKAVAECKSLSCTKVKYVLVLLEELAAAGAISVKSLPLPRRLMGQYTCLGPEIVAQLKSGALSMDSVPASKAGSRNVIEPKMPTQTGTQIGAKNGKSQSQTREASKIYEIFADRPYKGAKWRFRNVDGSSMSVRFETKEQCEKVCREILPEATIRFAEELAKNTQAAATVKKSAGLVIGDKIKLAAAPTPDVLPVRGIGHKSDPTPHGFYFEFIKHTKPYAIRDLNNPHIGIMCQLPNKAEAERYINDRERDAEAHL